MNGVELITWLRGPGLQISSICFLFGISFRVAQTLLLGRQRDLAPARGNKFSAGVATIFRRSFFHPGMTYRTYFTLIAGYTFHLAWLVCLFFLSQHILFFESVLGFGWPGFNNVIIDISTVLAMAALIAVLIHRFMDPVMRLLTDYQDYLTWTLTILPLLTGFEIIHPMLLSYQTALALHLISVELLLIAIPFTKLSHMITIFISRWYNGALAGYKGVKA
jgi:hypothetical protein